MSGLDNNATKEWFSMPPDSSLNATLIPQQPTFNSTETLHYQLRRQEQYLAIIFTILGIICVLFIVVSNGIVLLLIKKNKALRSTSNYYIVSLCVANILAGVVGIPAMLSTHFTNDTTGNYCKTFQYFIHLSDLAEVNSLVAVAYHRYRVFAYGMTPNKSVRISIALISCVWVIAIFYSIRAIYMFEQVTLEFWNNGTYSYVQECFIPQYGKDDYIEMTAKRFIIADFVLLFVLPVGMMVILYSLICWKIKSARTVNRHDGRRIRMFKTIVLLVGLFVVCSLPYYALEIYIYLGPGPFQSQIVLEEVFELVAFTNFGLNAIVYAFLGENFRKALRGLGLRKNKGNKVQPVVEDNIMKAVPKIKLSSIS